MGFRLGSKRIGPFRVNFGKNGGITSVSMTAGPTTIRLWSANGQRGLSSINTPGMGSIRRNLSMRARQRDLTKRARRERLGR